jgi:hypothetical protein
VAAIAESLPGFVSDTWYAIVAPPKTPDELAAKLSLAIAEALRQPDVIKKLDDLLLTPGGGSPRETAAFLKEETERWRKVIVSTGDQAELKSACGECAVNPNPGIEAMFDTGEIVGNTDSNFTTFLARLDTAQEKFARGRPDDFKALWSHTGEVTLAGGYGGHSDRGWDKVGARLDWASATYQDGARSNQIISGCVAEHFAYVVRKEIIEARIGGQAGRSRHELRVTMIFRRGPEGWRIVHRHADSMTRSELPF